MISGKRRFSLVVACCIVLGALAVWQHSVSREEMMLCEIIRHEQERHLEMQQAARDRPQALLDAIAKTKEELDTMRRLLPVEMDLDGFLGGFAECLAGHGLDLCSSSSQVRDRDFYREADLLLELCGPEADLAALTAEPRPVHGCAEPRMTRLSQAEMVGDRLRVEMTAYSFIDYEPSPHKNWCDARRWPEIRSWMWPFAGWAKAARARLEELCPEIEQHRAELDRVLDLEDLREEVQRTKHIIDALVERGAVP